MVKYKYVVNLIFTAIFCCIASLLLAYVYVYVFYLFLNVIGCDEAALDIKDSILIISKMSILEYSFSCMIIVLCCIDLHKNYKGMHIFKICRLDYDRGNSTDIKAARVSSYIADKASFITIGIWFIEGHGYGQKSLMLMFILLFYRVWWGDHRFDRKAGLERNIQEQRQNEDV